MPYDSNLSSQNKALVERSENPYTSLVYTDYFCEKFSYNRFSLMNCTTFENRPLIA